MKNTFFSLILIFTLSACKDKRKEVDPCGCAGSINCTLEYRNITIDITDKNGKPYLLDKYKVTRAEDGREIIIKTDEYTAILQSLGKYLFVGDGHQSLTDKCGKLFRFTGWKDGKEVISKDYLVAHDCCHILIKEGDTKVVIN
jgi:hypothetical protein